MREGSEERCAKGEKETRWLEQGFGGKGEARWDRQSRARCRRGLAVGAKPLRSNKAKRPNLLRATLKQTLITRFSSNEVAPAHHGCVATAVHSCLAVAAIECLRPLIREGGD